MFDGFQSRSGKGATRRSSGSLLCVRRSDSGGNRGASDHTSANSRRSDWRCVRAKAHTAGSIRAAAEATDTCYGIAPCNSPAVAKSHAFGESASSHATSKSKDSGKSSSSDALGFDAGSGGRIAAFATYAENADACGECGNRVASARADASNAASSGFGSGRNATAGLTALSSGGFGSRCAAPDQSLPGTRSQSAREETCTSARF